MNRGCWNPIYCKTGGFRKENLLIKNSESSFDFLTFFTSFLKHCSTSSSFSEHARFSSLKSGKSKKNKFRKFRTIRASQISYLTDLHRISQVLTNPTDCHRFSHSHRFSLFRFHTLSHRLRGLSQPPHRLANTGLRMFTCFNRLVVS